MKNIRIFYLKIFLVLVVKFSIYLNWHVFMELIMENTSLQEDVMHVQIRIPIWPSQIPDLAKIPIWTTTYI